MKTEIGEYIVGAWLKLVEKCDFVDYNVRPPVKGLEGLGELDVVGVRLKNKTIFLCEVTTHLSGIGYYDFPTTLKKVREKFSRQKKYAEKHLPKDFRIIFMFWSPVVSPKYAKAIEKNNVGLEIIFNSEYSKRIEEVKDIITGQTKDFGNPFIRMLQIIEALKCPCGSGKKYKKCGLLNTEEHQKFMNGKK